jgi:oligopeptide/dipeptide ABC transporter ATP-binding protein
MKKELLLQVRNLKVHFPIGGGFLRPAIGAVRAVDDVSFDVHAGETLGLVGESGCGKTTLGRAIVRLYEPTSGSVLFKEQDLARLKAAPLRNLRRSFQMIFQDPGESLNARHTVGYIVEEPLLIHRIGTAKERQKRVDELLERVGLPARARQQFPHEFSGGQRQRIGIARALTLKPDLIVCDEPVSALDVSIQSQILNLLNELQKEMGLAYLFIAHGLAVVKHMSDRIAVMYLGRIVELADSVALYHKPLHPYTQALISAIPHPDPTHRRERIVLKGEVPSSLRIPSGCAFHTRCPYVQDICRTQTPPLATRVETASNSHLVACHFAGKVG